MLRFTQKPDDVFTTMVTSSLDLALDYLTREECKWKYERILEWFGEQKFVETMEKLLEAHQSERLYMPNDYHFLILDEILSDYIEEHNEGVEIGGPQEIGSYVVNEIDWDLVHEIFFWDSDYRLSPIIINNLSSDQKKQMRVNQELFNVVNRLPPHDDDLLLEEVCEQNVVEYYLKHVRDHYRQGENYPCLD